ncbi:hypothetical protein N7492_005998 [Penicillium capsulatum]|uniref:Uncharacterized protein n=1 Tax=Penicillium capsulatum TaxID=69766 RepID=A0A9W9IDB0_9EURO|nr:hypothetical protein N7492_005998 [Penicillium capsulatum]KAJ6134898.1 hypothetical protein N7512_000058 [Penicillium capsulatum]
MSPSKTHLRGTGPTPKTSQSRATRKSDPVQAALQASNDDLQSRMSKLRTNVSLLDREILLLQRHVRDSHHPYLETWEADIITRLIEVAHTMQDRKLPEGLSIGMENAADVDLLSRAYSNAAKRIKHDTLGKLGLQDQGYHDLLMSYHEVRPFPNPLLIRSTDPLELAIYRSPNPFQTEVPFAKWLVEEKENRPEKYFFWGNLYPVCYGRTVEESAVIF